MVFLALLYGPLPRILSTGIYALPITALLNSFAFLFAGRGHRTYLSVLNLVITTILLVDLMYARSFGQLVSIDVVMSNNTIEGLGPSILALFRWADLLLLVDLLFLPQIYHRVGYPPSQPRRIRTFLFVFLFSAMTVGAQFAELRSGRDLADRTSYALRLSPMGTHALDAYETLRADGEHLQPNEIDAIEKWFTNNRQFQDPAPRYANLEGIFEGKNVIAIQFESLENILIGSSYRGAEVTPTLNSLLPESIYFSNIVEQVRDGNSSDAELMFNASILPMTSGSAFLRFPDNTYTTLPLLLADRGYISIAVHGDKKEFWNRDRVFPHLGYSEYVSEEQFTETREVGLGVLDEVTFMESLNVMTDLSTPFNIHIITVTSHTPFDLPEDLRLLDLETSDSTSDYLQSIRYADAALGDFYSALESRGILEDSVIVIYGDHEGVHKYNDTWLPRNSDEVPLLIHAPGFAGFEVENMGGQVDMMPTLAFLLGLDKGEYGTSVMGRNLLGGASGTAIQATGLVLEGATDPEELSLAYWISDRVIRSDYFGTK